ncbi:hypothetical protein [Neopoerus faecalis]|jgi:hypothetical protein|uniref:hypothetical protein n=1 Tax=Neopoerus faecalis TaxID=3032125 RepID=UPI00257087B5|nr:hypothetical protein [Neopoerus faecalis]
MDETKWLIWERDYVEGVHEIVSEVYSKQAAYAELRHLQKEHPDTIYEIEEDGPDFSDYEL